MHGNPICPVSSIVPVDFTTYAPGAPQPNLNQIPFFHHLLCRWPTAITTDCLWGVIIEPRNERFFANLIGNVADFEPSIYGSWSVVNGFDAVWTYDNQKQVGCIFAQGVQLPGDGMGISFAGAPAGQQRGFLNVPVAGDRHQINTVSISMLETNSSFADFCLRPWTVMTAHKGMLAYPDSMSIKAHITAFQMAKAGVDVPLAIRKIYSFYDCVPIDIDGESLVYSADTSAKERVVNFAYNYYTVNNHEFVV